LPPIERIKLGSEVDFYGLSFIIANKLCLEIPPMSSATWMHGWVFNSLKYPEQIIWGDKKTQCHLVAKEEHALFLRQHGYKNVVAAGLPFMYADMNEIERNPNSLLVMPPHSLPQVDIRSPEKEYIDYISDFKTKFSKIVFCLHQSCVENNHWISNLEKANIPWVIGASADDKNSLFRMQTLFRSFEYMTTNNIGSHVLYASYCGCKVSIAGPETEMKREYFKNDEVYKKYPYLLDVNLSSMKNALKQFPFLFVNPDQAINYKKWANEEIGVKYRKDEHELRKLFGWDSWPQIRYNSKFRIVKKMITNLQNRVFNN